MIESKGYKITPIDGDLAVSRNAEVGGNVDIHGKARVAGSLKIEGFLDAPNIKGVVKGLFATEEELKREYPNPRPGWCAIVLADDERGFLYLAKNIEWEKQSEEAKPFDFIADSINVFASKGELADETQRAQSAEGQLQLNIDEETTRATVEEEELLKRLQGVSENSNASTDPFKFLGNLSKTKFFETIDALNGDSVASREKCAGHFRAAVGHRIVDVYSEQIGWENNVWVQRMVCPMQLFNKVTQKENDYTKTGVDKDGNTVYYIYRTHTYTQDFDTLTGASTNQNTVKTYTRTCNNGVWGDWKDVSNNYINSPSYGKKIAFFGGSFAQNMSLTSTPWSFEYQGRTYSLMQYIAEKLGATSFDDYAVGSQGVIVGDIPIMEQLQTAGAGYDIYVIFGGINDFGNEIPLGESNGAADDTTYCGGLKKAIDWIRSNNKSAKIYTVTPFKAYKPDDRYWNPRSNIKKKGHTFYEFIQAQKEVAQIHGVPCFDLWANQQFSGASAWEHYYTDLLHPNGKGYQAVADALVEFLAYGLGSGVLDAYAVLPNATYTTKGLMSAEDKKKIVKSITWNNDTDPSNMNDFTVAGVYDIKGERKRDNDNLPILNTGGGHSFNAKLTVLDSSISGSGENNDKCITQVLSFSNRLGQGEVYIRTGKGSSLDNLTWENWSTLQRNVNVGEINSIDNLKDNGIYSGVWKKGHLNAYPLTFVCVVINDYFVGISPRRISQFVYGLSKFDGSTIYQSRVWDDSKNTWGDWEILNQEEITSMISSEIKKVTDGVDPEKLDSLKDLIAWVDTHGGEVAGIKSDIQANTKKVNASIKNIDVSPNVNEVELDLEDNAGRVFHVAFPAATTEKAGVMSAEDKKEIADNKTAIKAETKRATAAETNAIEQGKRAALIDMYRALGASYNSSTDTFTFNTVAGLSWQDMAATFINRDMVYRLNLPRVGQQIANLRVINPLTNILTSPAIKIQGLNTFYGTIIELLAFCKLSNTTYDTYLNDARIDTAPVCTYLYDTFRQCSKLKVVFPINIRGCQTLKKECFSGCVALEELRLLNLPLSLNLADSPLISKASILYIVTNAAPTTAITITLHADAYARLANDADIVAALAAQPLITLVSA